MKPKRTMRTPPKIRKPPVAGFAKLAPVVAAVDAAKVAPAWALAERGELVACGYNERPGTGAFDWAPLTPVVQDFGREYRSGIHVCALEVSPPRGQADGNPVNVFEMNVGGALCAGSMRAAEVVLVYPAEWTGTVKDSKPSRHWAVWQALTPREREIVAAHFGTVDALWHHLDDACCAVSLGRKPKYSHPIHNILDAVGLLLFAVGRIGRAGAKVRDR